MHIYVGWMSSSESACRPLLRHKSRMLAACVFAFAFTDPIETFLLFIAVAPGGLVTLVLFVCPHASSHKVET